MESKTDLEKTYSREQQRLDGGFETVATPVALVTSVTSRSQKSQISSRSRPQEENSRAAYLGNLKTEIDTTSYQDDYDKIEEAAPQLDPASSTASRTVSRSNTSNMSPRQPLERKLVRFEDGDPENPNNSLSPPRTSRILLSPNLIRPSSAAGAIEPISRHFNQTSEYVLILPTSMLLVGYVFGPMAWGPLSESYGRKGTMIYSFALFTIFSIASAVAPNFAALVVFRLFVGIGGSCAISVVGGICADVWHDPRSRGRSMATFMAATTFGPILGPPVSGYISTISWSWGFWIGAICAGATWPLFIFFPETYGPAILKKRAQKLRKETGDETIVAPLELEKTDLNHIVTVVLTRPIRMIFFEPLVLFTCLYLSYAYSIFYIYLQSYPLIFTGIYSFSSGETGLTFLCIAVGAIISAFMYLAWDSILARAQRLQRPWSQKEEMRRLPLGCIAGPFFVISSFWLGWSAREDVHWVVPTLAGVLFGMGYLCLFMALLNYLVDAYEIFAASAMAAASLSRSIFGAILPFGAKPMYRALGVPWATSLLGFFSLALCVVPFAFIRWGGKMRERSPFCQYLIQKKQEEAERREVERADATERKGKGDV
ncbi:major facilitator superfamily domain-containing protein [Phaeosphaeriaceae sp. PMI808]|nr:major facilitator superfamily domain-containing protein [Phaeosphaeriaceae sp. PMI808]